MKRSFLASLSMRPADSEPPDLYDDPRYERVPWEPPRALNDVEAWCRSCRQPGALRESGVCDQCWRDAHEDDR